jgi:hypothetical protein
MATRQKPKAPGAAAKETPRKTRKPFEILPAEEAQKYKLLALQSQQMKSQLELLRSEQGQFRINESKDQVFGYENEVVVQFPVLGGAAHSSITTRFNRVTDQLNEIRATLYLQDASMNITSKTFINGRTRLNLTLSEAGGLLQGRAFDAAGKEMRFEELAVAKGVTWDCMNDCLADQGIPAWVVTSIGIACAAICVVTVGVGCFGCIASAAGVAAGTIWHCIGECD